MDNILIIDTLLYILSFYLFLLLTKYKFIKNNELLNEQLFQDYLKNNGNKATIVTDEKNKIKVMNRKTEKDMENEIEYKDFSPLEPLPKESKIRDIRIKPGIWVFGLLGIHYIKGNPKFKGYLCYIRDKVRFIIVPKEKVKYCRYKLYEVRPDQASRIYLDKCKEILRITVNTEDLNEA